MYLLIVFIPLVTSLVSGLGGRFIGKLGSQVLTSLGVLMSATLSSVAFYEVGICGSPCYVEFLPWISSDMLRVYWGFQFDSLTVVMLVVVTYVSTLVHLYSIGYMSEDPHIPRFMSYLSLFTFFMLMLVTGDNLVQLFFGWEGVGVCSYLLISFWYTRIQANKAALKAMVMNRVGDFGLSLGIFASFYVFKSLDYATIFSLAPYYVDFQIPFLYWSFGSLNLIGILLFVGAVGKSAQLGLHTWLPDAMEGPTPVSALIHAATMVTAGVFLISRCSPLYEYAPKALLVVTIIGGTTAFFAATTGLVQNDLKRVIAYSTCSQLGYMIFACGLSGYSIGMFHLMNHAFFKALLFLSAGSVIHALADEQDMRKMGGMLNIVPLTYTMMLIGSMSLMGFPFLTGFYSKDVILEFSFAKYTIDSSFVFWLGVISAFFTAFYSFRLIYLTFFGEPNSIRSVVSKSHDAPVIMALPLMLLCLGSVFVGYIFRDLIIGLGTDFWGSALYVSPHNSAHIDSEFIPHMVKLMPVCLSVLGALASLYVYEKLALEIGSLYKTAIWLSVYKFLNGRWLFDSVYNYFVAEKLMSFGYHISFKTLDKGIIEFMGPSGLISLISTWSIRVSRLNTGYLYHSAFLMMLGAVIVLGVTRVCQMESDIAYVKLAFVQVICGLFYLGSVGRDSIKLI
uniref:NADH-ubiquinone oxidoreductase chain 5 n=1 Tax=Ophirina amphinema TaxID=2108040 RepID=A0A348AYT0_9EUKA|nr:NADH dehydrogenase subunit 5 [Ophirina amphinema]